MFVRFWGVRGSIASPGPSTVQFGGNTACVEVRAGGITLIFDGGTGLRMLGKALLSEMPIEAHLFFSHVHWDHIQGFPFFDPAFIPGNKIHLYGGPNVSRTLEETLAGQMDYPSFPVHLSAMGATMRSSTCSKGRGSACLQGTAVKLLSPTWGATIRTASWPIVLTTAARR